MSAGRLEIDPNSRYTITDMDDDVPEKPNRPPTFAGQAFDSLPPGDRLHHVVAVGNEQPPTGLQDKLETSIRGGVDMSQPPFVPNRSVAEIEAEQRQLEASIGDGGPSPTPEITSSTPSTEPDPSSTLSRRALLRKTGRVAVPLVVGAATITGAPEKAKHTFDFLGVFSRLFGQKKDEVAQAAAPVGEALDQLTLNGDQREALEALNKPDAVKSSFIVMNDPDVVQNGLAFRGAPHIPLPTEEPNIFDRLKPGDTITDAIYWQSKKPEFTSTADVSTQPNWVAYQRNGKVGFSYAGYLKADEQPKSK